jgi:hypothetical protein
MTNNGTKLTFKATSEMGERLRVKYIAPGTVGLAGAGEEDIGFTEQRVTSWNSSPNGTIEYSDVAVLMTPFSGSAEAIADGPIAANAQYYSAAGGKISATVSGAPLGRVLKAVSADGDYAQVTRY